MNAEIDVLNRLTELSEEIASGTYRKSEELFELTKTQKYSAQIARLAESFGMMMVQVEAREYRLEQIIQQLRSLNDKLRVELDDSASCCTELQQQHSRLEDVIESRTTSLLKANETLKAEIETRKAIQLQLAEHREHLSLINTILRHDLVNNLAVIQSGLRLYHAEGDEEMYNQTLQSIIKSRELIVRMKELEVFLSSNTGLKITDLHEAMKQSAHRFPQLQVHIHGHAKILADEALDSVLDNLLRNALLHGKAETIDCTITPRNGDVLCSVADNGCGIPDEIKDAVFDERFTYGSTGQSGLGLFIVKRTMIRYGGSVEVIDNLPQGAHFRLYFKRVR
jgi:signal transduction histidine kinase